MALTTTTSLGMKSAPAPEVDPNAPKAEDPEPSDGPRTTVKPTKVDRKLGVDPENDSPEHDEWLKAVSESPMVRDDGMTKFPTAPDDGIEKVPPEKPQSKVDSLMAEADKKNASEVGYQNTDNTVEHLGTDKGSK